MNIAPLIAQEFHQVRIEPWSTRRLEEYDPSAVDAFMSSELARAIARPVPLKELEAGRVGLLTVRRSVWERLAGFPDEPRDSPGAWNWLEAAPLEDGDVLVYPNDRGDAPEVAAYAPLRAESGGPGPLPGFLGRLSQLPGVPGGNGRERWLLPRLRLDLKGNPEPALRLESDACTPLVEGELEEREIVCVETGCAGNCTRRFYRDGVEIIECDCPR